MVVHPVKGPSKGESKGHKVAVIGGDGIGPEVIGRGRQGRARRRRRARDRRVRPRRRAATCAPARCCPTRSSRSCAASTPSCLGAVGTPDVPPGVLERGLLLRLRFDARPLRQPPPVRAGPSAQRRRRLRGRAREHRGHLRRRRRVPAQGHAARGRDPGLGEHPLRRRALRALRVRARAARASAAT